LAVCVGAVLAAARNATSGWTRRPFSDQRGRGRTGRSQSATYRAASEPRQATGSPVANRRIRPAL